MEEFIYGVAFGFFFGIVPTWLIMTALRGGTGLEQCQCIFKKTEDEE